VGRRVFAHHQVERQVGGVRLSSHLPGIREEVVRDVGGRLPAAPVQRAGPTSPVRGLAVAGPPTPAPAVAGGPCGGRLAARPLHGSSFRQAATRRGSGRHCLVGIDRG